MRWGEHMEDKVRGSPALGALLAQDELSLQPLCAGLPTPAPTLPSISKHQEQMPKSFKDAGVVMSSPLPGNPSSAID